METKQVNKAVTKIVDKFATVYTQYENGLATEDQLKKNACSHIAVLTRLVEVDALAVDHIQAGFVEVIKAADREVLDEAVDKVCTDLYALVRQTQD
jgi:hypothetical protein